MSYAVIQVLGKQYHVTKGSKITCDQMKAVEGDQITIDILGSFNNFKSKGTVKATVLKHFLGDKKIVFYKTQRGHDQHLKGFRARHTMLRIDEINVI